MNDLLISFIRTITPSIIGALGSFAASKGINIPDDQLAALIPLMTTVFTSVFYLIARFLEKKYPEAVSLLIVKKQPKY